MEYRVLRELGRGSYGKVCLARAYTAKGERHHVAMKFAREAANVEDMRAEHKLLCDLAHPNVIAAVDFLCGDDMQKVSLTFRAYKVSLVMEPASSDLAAFLEVHGPCRNAGLTRDWCRDVAVAVAHIHGRGVVHRDIKPANLLVCLDGDSVKSGAFIRARIKLSDFGCARVLPRGPKNKIVGKKVTFKAEDGQVEHSLERQFDMTAHVCTAWYRAPELLVATSSVQRLDRQTEPGATQCYGASVDVWSFGAVVYELLSGKQLARAFSGADLLNCLLQKLEPCPYPCLDAGKGDLVPAYMAQPGWDALHQAACKLPKSHRAWPVNDERWNVVGTCLRWHPSHRPPMIHVLCMPWLLDVTSEASHAALDGSDPVIVSGRSLAASSHARAPFQEHAAPALRGMPACAPTPGRLASGPPALSLSRDYNTRDTVTSEIACRCKGNCRTYRHREQGKCDEAALVKNTAYCTKCLCKVYGCVYAKHRSDFCFMHKRILDQLPLHVRLAVLAADVACRLVPCEIVDFLTLYQEIKSDLAMCIICAIVNEPVANAVILAQWRQLPPNYEATSLAQGLEAAVRACDSTPDMASAQQAHGHQMKQGDGAARCWGVAVCGESLGLLRKAPHKTDGLSLDRTKHKYVFTGDTSTIAEFLALVRAETNSGHPPCFDARAPGVFNQVQGYAHRVRRLMQGCLTHEVATRSGTGCDVDAVVRRLCMPLYAHMPWDTIPSLNVQTTCVAAPASWTSFPDNWSAAQLSAFVCQRPDWPWLVSVFTGLWNEYADSEPAALDIISKLCTSPPGASTPCALTQAADAFYHQHGHMPHPCELLMDNASVAPTKRSFDVHAAPSKRRAKGSASAESTWAPRWWQWQRHRPQHQ